MKKQKKKILNFFLLTFLFFLIIFFVRIIFSEENYLEEEKIVENLVLDTAKNENIFEKIPEKQEEKIVVDMEEIKKQERENKIIYDYIPFVEFSNATRTIIAKKFFDTFFHSKVINDKIDFLVINFYKEKFDVRGRFKDRKIHIFWLHSLPFKEALAVWIHEFWHFYDIYILKKYVFNDLSDKFYDISWDEKRVLKKDSKNIDFVSGYAMSNRYEDFAESFTFYVLHNKEFLKRAEKSERLQEKYNFFRKYIFIYDEFVNSEISINNFPKNIWDTTKLDYNFDDLKKYLEK